MSVAIKEIKGKQGFETLVFALLQAYALVT